jgi:hypothetical protein
LNECQKKGRFFALAAIILKMKFSSCLVILILVGTAVFTAGCTQGTGPVQTATPLPVITSRLQDLALDPADVPACFSLTEQSVKSPGDVGQLAKDLGWQEGYVVTYTCPVMGHQPTIILQSLVVYPAENMPGIASMVDEQDRSAGYIYEALSFPDQGSAMRGFYGKANETQTSDQSPGTYLVSGGRVVPETNAVSGSDVGEIIIYRGTYFEVLRMTGSGTNATILRDIALKASAKIP